MSPQAFIVQKMTSWDAGSLTAIKVKFMSSSETMKVTGTKWIKKHVLLRESHGVSSVASTSDSGRPSGIVSKRKEGKSLR